VWICRREGKIVGSLARIPFPLKVGDDETRSQWGINLIVDPGWRGHGIAAGMIPAASAQTRFSCAVGLSEDGTRTAIRNGYTTVGAVPAYVYALDPTRLLRRRGVSSWVQRAAIPFAYLAGQAAVSWCRLRSVGFDLVPMELFDDRADQIWRDASPDYDVIARRDTARLQWRFDQSPDRDHYLRFLLLRHGLPVGYAVLRATTWHDEPAIKVVDYLTPTRYLGPLFAHTIRAARDHGASIMRCRTLNHRARLPLHSLGFITARAASRTHELQVFARDDEDSARPLLSDPENWFVTDADSDLD